MMGIVMFRPAKLSRAGLSQKVEPVFTADQKTVIPAFEPVAKGRTGFYQF